MVPSQSKSLAVRIPLELHRRVKVAAAAAGRSLQDVVIDALMAVFERAAHDVNRESRRA